MEDSDSKIIFFREPDPMERILRLVCGALLGILVGGFTWVRYGLSLPAGATVTALSVVLCALGARKYGDDFWHRFFEFWNWPWGRR